MNNNLGSLFSSEKIMPSSQRQTHVYVIGQPGTGKSRLLESWFMQDVLAGNGAGIIDPHGDLFNHLLARITTHPEVWHRVIIINPCDPKWAVPINPLASVNGTGAIRMAWFLTDIILNIWSLKMADAPRMSWLMGNTFSAMAELGLPLVQLPRFLLDADYRDQQVLRIQHSETRSFFEYEFPRSAGAVRQWVGPLLNKIGGFLYDPDIRSLLSGSASLDFRQVLDESCILLVNIPKGILGESASGLLGAFIVAQLQKAALGRADSTKRKPFYLYLDEFQNYTSDNIADILSEARKYALSLIIAHQYLSQLNNEIREAVLNTSGTLLSFRVGYNDATKLAKHIFPHPSYLGSNKVRLDVGRSGMLPRLQLRQEKSDMGWEACAQSLASLPMRKFWMRSRSNSQPACYHSLYMPDPLMTAELQGGISALVEASGFRYARVKNTTQAGEIDERYASDLSHNTYIPQAGRQVDDFPLWGS